MALHEKLKTIQSELKAPKGQTNNFGGYKYRSCEDILEAVKPLAHEQGCIVTLSDTIVEVGGRIYVKATATITDGEGAVSTDSYAREAEDKKGMDTAQITGSASSYARKYALNGLFCIDDTKDDDTRENTDTKRILVKTREETNKASSGDIVRIANLCKETGTDLNKIYDHFKVIASVPTKAQSATIIKTLEDRLNKQLNDAATAQ